MDFRFRSGDPKTYRTSYWIMFCSFFGFIFAALVALATAGATSYYHQVPAVPVLSLLGTDLKHGIIHVDDSADAHGIDLFAIPAYEPAEHKEDYHRYPKYQFGYDVNDPFTGDLKTHHEERDGDVVRGYYALAEPDGTHRIVHYTADKINGFNAIVKKIGHAVHPVPALPKTVIIAVPEDGHKE
ncbi:hypothetical protein NQ318_021920 [Aromia moschata]|uniref:Uncharacterized protein n=1 Tax=Aromia moschata TaxID=1265417 RepID=A0AAV8X9A4_9CUCU|nr:hypothetical protein NQ318_021920 [Aromia moschata]